MLLAHERRELEVTTLSTPVFGDDGTTISMQRSALASRYFQVLEYLGTHLDYVGLARR